MKEDADYPTDLDTLASSISLWWYRHVALKNENVIPLIQTPRGDLKLRPENEHALSLASLDPKHEDLLCIDDIPAAKSIPFPTNTFALVDHNRLLARFAGENPAASVVALVDHHEDEGLHLDANPRIVRTPIGSAASLVAQYIKNNLSSGVPIPPEISSLLLLAILIDTGGLKPGGKAELVDRTSAAMLYPLSTFAKNNGLLPSEADNIDPSKIHENENLQTIYEDLEERKNDVHHLEASDLLKRDYKQYHWTFRIPVASDQSEKNSGPTRAVQVGLSTVPVGLDSWLPRSQISDFFDTISEYMASLKLDVVGILTSFREVKLSEPDGHPEKEKGKHRRQLMLIFRSPGGDEENQHLTPGLVQHVYSSLLSSNSAKVLDLEEVAALKFFGDGASVPSDWHSAVGGGGFLSAQGFRLDVRLFKQKNAKATRKIIAPLLKRIIEGDLEGEAEMGSKI